MKNSAKKSIEFEIRFYEGILRRSPDFLEALIALGDLYTRAGRYEDGLRVDMRLACLRPDSAVVFYNLACSYSLLGKVDHALETVKCAIALGYEDFDLLEKDDDLENLRQDSRFQKYYQVIRAEALKNRCPDPKEPQKIFKDQ